MRKFGANKTALHFRRRKGANEGEAEAEVEDGETTNSAQIIVRELYLRYEKQLQRWRDYRNLFVFLGFVALYLAVLYLQRHADVAYDVHSTISSVTVDPLPGSTMQSTDDVYSWIQGLLETVWQDPVCGDGLCEQPFEFASYSRFGCRADCGKLNLIQNLTKIQVDLYFDFSHPVGSMPSSDLMQQASWNLCPVETDFSSDCYYSPDNSFDRLSGDYHYTIDDCPDGSWNLTVKRDTFNKIQGAVRQSTQVALAGFYYKIYTAATAAIAEQQREVDLLNQAVANSTLSLFDWVNQTVVNLNASVPTNFDAQQLINGTCLCGNNASFVNDMMTALNNSADPLNPTVVFPASTYIADYAAYQALSICRPGGGAPTLYELEQYECVGCTNCTTCPSNYTVVSNSSLFTGSSNSSLLWRPKLSTNLNAACLAINSTLWSYRTAFFQVFQTLLINQRLGNTQTTGKRASRNAVITTIQTYLNNNYPELVDPVFNTPAGTNPNAPIDASVATLSQFYVDGKTFSVTPPPAQLDLRLRMVSQPNMTTVELGTRSTARIAEVQFQQQEVGNLSLTAPDGTTFLISDLLSSFSTANAQTNTTFTTLPSADDSDLGSFAVNYNLVTWQGNTTAYAKCDLINRGPDYVGICIDRNVSCVINTDNPPYNCTEYATGIPIAGNLSVEAYRTSCEAPCDRYFDCGAICECFDSCSDTQTCSCKQCEALNPLASSDSEFVTILQQASSSISVIASLPSTSRRRLLQQSNDTVSQLNTVVSTLSDVKQQQAALSTKMTQLQDEVTTANQLAQARANDNRLIELITAGRQDIAAGQAAVQSKLDEIIGKQQQALQAAQDAAKALSAIQDLQQKQIQAQQALETAVNNQLTAIRTATKTGIITLTQALQLWKRARRDRAFTEKFTRLSNIPCTSFPSVSYQFDLDNGNLGNGTEARERNIGLTNRVIGGLLLHQWRTDQTKCSDSKFDKIQPLCTGPLTIQSYGVDPIFKSGTDLYNPDLDDVYGQLVVGYYNCSELANGGTYNVTDTVLNKTTNYPPYCAELYNKQDSPYAFHYFPLQGKDPGFPIWFDINLSADDAQTWFTYMSEGLYLDQKTRGLTAELITYNAPLRVFGYFRIRFFFSDGGSIQVSYRLYTVTVEMYATSEDTVRFVLEIILNICIAVLCLIQLFAMVQAHKEKGHFMKYFLSGWAWVDTISNALLVTCCILWWIYVADYANQYDISLRFDVYASLTPDANYLALNANGQNLEAAWDAFSSMDDLINILNWYYALNGINILLLIARVLKLMDFQPRLGIVTRSLWLAGPDLIHFAIVAGMVFIGYAMMAHLIFGNAIEEFSTFGDSINTCFEILLGNIDVNQELRELGGLQSVAGALFFWSYELLVFMVLLNFLLAIIVDAFSEIKEKTHETVGLHTELAQLLRDKWRSLVGRATNNYISDRKLGQLLKQWAGEDNEEDAAAGAGEEGPKVVKVFDEDFDEATLFTVLARCKEDAHFQEPEEDEKDKKKGLLAKCLPGKKNKKALATDDEIKIAAHYIVDRFGVAGAGAEEEEEEANAPAATGGEGGADGGMREAALEKERDQLAQALERLAEVQRELAEGQRSLMSGQKQLAEQQGRLVALMNTENQQGQEP